jgi:hypothetical protein
MTKRATIVALFFAVASIAATASLVNEPATPGHEPQTASTDRDSARRGTRTPLVLLDDADPAVGNQPRRGDRPELALAESADPSAVTDGLRRGTR